MIASKKAIARPSAKPHAPQCPARVGGAVDGDGGVAGEEEVVGGAVGDEDRGDAGVAPDHAAGCGQRAEHLADLAEREDHHQAQVWADRCAEDRGAEEVVRRADR